jgi:polar amino acid transport system substrate-binding protein
MLRRSSSRNPLGNPLGVLACLACVTFLNACGIPRDPEATLDRVTGGTLRVGYAFNDPWVVPGEDGPGGVEAELVERFAADIDAEIEWTEGSEAEVIEALEVGELDVAIAGLAATAPWTDMAAITHPYVTTQVVVGIPEGDEIPEDIAGLEVAVERGTSDAGLLEETDAVPVEVEDIAGAEGPAATDDWLLEDLDLNDSGVTLEEVDHVMAIRLGENGFMVELERFLLERPGLVDQLLAQEEP